MDRSIMGYISHFLYKRMSLDSYLRLFFLVRMKKRLDLNNPKSFNEKLCWLRKYYKEHMHEEIQCCFDKYRVRDFVRDKVGNSYLIPLLGVYNNADEINITKLPSQYIAKITQSCGKNYIVLDNDVIDVDAFKSILNNWQEVSAEMASQSEVEEYFYDGHPKIIIERLLTTKDNKLPDDYKMYCFNGSVELIRVAYNPIDEEGKRRDSFVYNTYDREWNFVEFEIGEAHNSDRNVVINKPNNFEEMCWVAEQLSKDFPFARVDLYNLEGEIYFGEITWFPGSSWNTIHPKEWEVILGEKLKLPFEK